MLLKAGLQDNSHLCRIMSETILVSGETKEEKYLSLLPQIKSLVEKETDFIANVSNILAALKYGMNFFWIGIYFCTSSENDKGKHELTLGPFQGPVACTRIPFGKGVCGTAWKEKKTIIVENVEKFPGHISCSNQSKSEIVVPCLVNGKVFAVLDVDSDRLNAFDETDKKYLEQIAEIISLLNEKN